MKDAQSSAYSSCKGAPVFPRGIKYLLKVSYEEFIETCHRKGSHIQDYKRWVARLIRSLFRLVCSVLFALNVVVRLKFY